MKTSHLNTNFLDFKSEYDGIFCGNAFGAAGGDFELQN